MQISPSDVRYMPLSDCPDYADICAAWSFGEWGVMQGKTDFEKARTTYRKAARNNKKLPHTWIAALYDRPVGMVSIFERDHPDIQELTPWLGSLFVHHRFRGLGIARTLMARIEEQAAKIFGIEVLYLFTPDMAQMYEKLGWADIGRARDPAGLAAEGVTLMKKMLNNDNAGSAYVQ